MSDNEQESDDAQRKNCDEQETIDHNDGVLDRHGEDPDLNDETHSSSSDDEEASLLTDRYWPPPTGETVEIIGSSASKALSAFSIDSAGTRFATGGNDNRVCIYDFEVIDRVRPRPIGVFEAETIVQQLEFSIDNQLLLVIPTTCQAVIISKDGSSTNKKVCAKGDPYLRGVGVTKGHTQMLMDGCWAPGDKNKFATCSMDATIRFWDLNNLTKQTLEVKTTSPENGRRIIPNVCRYSRDSNTVFSGNNDGTILMLDVRRRRSEAIKRAHKVGEITGLDQSYGLNKLCSRSEDGTCKLWDLRQTKQALGVRGDLPTLSSKTNCVFSPDDKIIVTSSSSEDGGGANARSMLHFIDALSIDEHTLESKLHLEAPVGCNIIQARWHPKINHLGYTTSDGRLIFAFDNVRSLGGGFLSASDGRAPPQQQANKRRKYELATSSTGAGGVVGVQRIITPHALPLFRDSGSTAAAAFAKIRQNPRQSYKPEMPAASASVKPAGSTLSSHIARNIAKPIADDGSMSIRDRILRHAIDAGDRRGIGNAAAADDHDDDDGAPNNSNNNN